MAENEYRNLDNEEYWTKRSEERTDKFWNKLGNVEKEMAKQYRLALDDLKMEMLNAIISEATEETITYQEATKSLTASQMETYKAKIERMFPEIRNSNDPKLVAEFEKLRRVTDLTRISALIANIEARLLLLGYEQQTTMEQWLASTYEDNYYQTIYQMFVGTGIGFSFATLNEEAIKQAITYAWSGDQFSSRIWNNKEKLVQELRQTLTQGIIKGEGNQKMARRLRDRMDVSYSNSIRLVRTETAFVLSESSYQGYKQNGIVNQYRLVATKDARTSKICQKIDGKVFNLDEKETGVNYPPFHANCRTVEAPYFSYDDLEDALQIARDNNGKTFYIPASMTYSEYEDKYIKKSVRS